MRHSICSPDVTKLLASEGQALQKPLQASSLTCLLAEGRGVGWPSGSGLSFLLSQNH